MRGVLERLVKRKVFLRDLSLLGLVVLLLVELGFLEGHEGYFFERIYGFWALFGIIGAFILSKSAKGLSHLFLSKKEDYYGGW
jgi:uncharacterized ion transporter superfamily protein YfcC